MRNVRFTDDSFSREVEDEDDDWETSGQDEMNKLHAECTQEASVLHARDKLNELVSLLTVCREALTESKLIHIKTIVGEVLYFYVEEEIKTIEKELSKV